MRPAETLRTQIRGLDNKDYGAYQSIRGEYRFPVFDLVVTQIPKDPYAPPYTGIYRMRLSHEYLKVPRSLFQGKVAGTAYRDFLARRFSRACGRLGNKRRGTGYSGLISIDTPGQAILDRSSIVYTQDGIEVRFFVGLPANGRKINASLAEQMLLAEVPNIAAHAFSDIDIAGVQEHIFAAEDAEYLRSWLAEQELVSFLADGALIPRESGVVMATNTSSRVKPLIRRLKMSSPLPNPVSPASKPSGGSVPGCAPPGGWRRTGSSRRWKECRPAE